MCSPSFRQCLREREFTFFGTIEKIACKPSASPAVCTRLDSRKVYTVKFGLLEDTEDTIVLGKCLCPYLSKEDNVFNTGVRNVIRDHLFNENIRTTLTEETRIEDISLGKEVELIESTFALWHSLPVSKEFCPAGCYLIHT